MAPSWSIGSGRTRRCRSRSLRSASKSRVRPSRCSPRKSGRACRRRASRLSLMAATASSTAASPHPSLTRRGSRNESAASSGVIESGLFVGRADPVFVTDPQGVHRLDSARAHRGYPPILVLMGVSGTGKSSVAHELEVRLGWRFEEGDTLHPEANVAKMQAGLPLTDADRQPWLESVAAWIDGQRAGKQPGIITCSALKRSYRQIVVGDRPEVRLVYLRGSREVIADHLAKRTRSLHAREPAAKSDRHSGRARARRRSPDRRRRPTCLPSRRGNHTPARHICDRAPGRTRRQERGKSTDARNHEP